MIEKTRRTAETKIVLQGAQESFDAFEKRLNEILIELSAKSCNEMAIPIPCCSSDGRMTMTIIYQIELVEKKKE